jgi:hypothetical protein
LGRMGSCGVGGSQLFRGDSVLTFPDHPRRAAAQGVAFRRVRASERWVLMAASLRYAVALVFLLASGDLLAAGPDVLITGRSMPE